MNSLKKYVFESIKSEILSWNSDVIKDIYVISLYISNSEDDPRRPMITLGYNNMEQYESALEDASDNAEAKWNFAFWLQNEELIIGDDWGENLEDGERISQWIKENNLYYSDEEEDEDFDKALKLGDEITSRFVELCVEVVKKLHEEGVIEKKFGKALPLIIHELEYYDLIAEQNKRANPKEIIKEFADWILKM
ncbi:hypothetical protein B0P06_003986 [Clostridium saccharoperbutylacetonicum]|uniref:DUF4303 domain-containing protein n=1 Tax=Clostridium saccharoperbutylacetonicum N1-4(HMT) TaxID=931276 RepID=M1LWX1_9CLOT|nr:hypothetical protein [Clostridium saccharoperbutylacetonicum]AGF57710.1 hypothetical protein Cspa_c39530 [Clostridium saccharoperbutylacetonicum N1-4(HMT)]NRT61522.1 hypothetical protein [Clostridium saccharoperbutylacetonicum]NSB24844.1 hypothetical protein [Clostridium saccharoperbutylacetonicum]NSB44215.1 hypothetical protein [Clostridium saccharoperbutylacetonicum]